MRARVLRLPYNACPPAIPDAALAPQRLRLGRECVRGGTVNGPRPARVKIWGLDFGSRAATPAGHGKGRERVSSPQPARRRPAQPPGCCGGVRCRRPAFSHKTQMRGDERVSTMWTVSNWGKNGPGMSQMVSTGDDVLSAASQAH